MKRLFIYSALALAAAFTSCKKDDLGPAATNLDANTFSATASAGAVKLQWAIPDNANYKYVEVKYNHPGTKKEHTRLASIHADTILIDGLLAAYGDIEYRLTPVTKTGNRGTTHKIVATCLPVPATTRVVDGTKEEITLTANKMWTDSNETSAGDNGGMPALIDNNVGTFWHVRWSSDVRTFPHHLVVELPEAISGAVSFYWKGRNNTGINNPKRLRILGFNEPFTGQTNVASGFNLANYQATEIASVQSGMPETQAAEYNSATFIFNGSYKYLWVEFQEERLGRNWIALAEWKFYKYQTETYNPETGETTRN
ncbi:MAG: DUF4959 domain-containing protein [Porphyromonas sp.]|nr:DUF4959 domain-containing protein [Porphyromonas sp.]